MVGQSVLGALEVLKAERARIDSAINSLESLIPESVGSQGTRAGRGKVGRPAAAAGGVPKAGGKRKKAARGLLKKYVHDALKKAGKTMAPIVLTDAVLKAGYPNRNRKTLYTAIFAAAKKDPAIKKLPEGFVLK